jgi:hypothetical protein
MGGQNMTTRLPVVRTIHAPFGRTKPSQPTLISRGFPNGDSDEPGGPGGHDETGSIRNPRLP